MLSVRSGVEHCPGAFYDARRRIGGQELFDEVGVPQVLQHLLKHRQVIVGFVQGEHEHQPYRNLLVVAAHLAERNRGLQGGDGDAAGADVLGVGVGDGDAAADGQPGGEPALTGQQPFQEGAAYVAESFQLRGHGREEFFSARDRQPDVHEL